MSTSPHGHTLVLMSVPPAHHLRAQRLAASRAASTAAAMVAVLALSACASAGGGAPAARDPVASSSSAVAIAEAQRDSALLPYTAADIHFMSGMIGHHAQAIQMSRMAPKNGASDQVRVLAERIINAQVDEIALMQTWLRDRRQPVPEAKPGPMRMMMNGHVHEMTMPGMLTDAQMEQLEKARGTVFDELFLTLMIQHHQGALHMVKELIDTPGAAQDKIVFRLASDINAEQETEINRMQRMLVLMRMAR